MASDAKDLSDFVVAANGIPVFPTEFAYHATTRNTDTAGGIVQITAILLRKRTPERVEKAVSYFRSFFFANDDDAALAHARSRLNGVKKLIKIRVDILSRFWSVVPDAQVRIPSHISHQVPDAFRQGEEAALPADGISALNFIVNQATIIG